LAVGTVLEDHQSVIGSYIWCLKITNQSLAINNWWLKIDNKEQLVISYHKLKIVLTVIGNQQLMIRD
jgi:hypothetical protein